MENNMKEDEIPVWLTIILSALFAIGMIVITIILCHKLYLHSHLT